MLLNEEQMLRCYQVFDFEDYEEIINGEINGEDLVIDYLDNVDNVVGHYKPTLEKEQLDFIMNGIKLERNEQ